MTAPQKEPPAKTKGRADALNEVCSVRIENRKFGLSIRNVIEILGKTSSQPVPLAPSFIGGMVHYRGDVLTVVSLRRLLEMSDPEGTQDILVVESTGTIFGLLVDSVGEVLTVHAEDYEPNPCTLDQKRSGLFAGAYKLQNQLIVMLDPERLDPMRLARTA